MFPPLPRMLMFLGVAAIISIARCCCISPLETLEILCRSAISTARANSSCWSALKASKRLEEEDEEEREEEDPGSDEKPVEEAPGGTERPEEVEVEESGVVGKITLLKELETGV